MRRTIAALLTLLAFASSLIVPAGLAAASPAKVVVIVGPVGSVTASYKADGDAVAAEALKYTPNVVKIYTPNATWAAVKPALQGANVVVYIGHGNGFPSPYGSTLSPQKQDGLGLNPVAGGGDTNVVYYGESILANEVRLAPNALVLLHHLCYASGNSEPGRGEPTLAVAQQRIDNFGAGFLAAGARAVIADAHFGSAYYMTALFTTDQTLDAVWRGAPGARGNYGTFASVRTPGALAQYDPDSPTSGFYRSFVGDPTLTTSAVTGGTATLASSTFPSVGIPPLPAAPVPSAPTAAGPSGFVVPGAAEVLANGGPLFVDPTLGAGATGPDASQVLPAGTPVRVQAAAGPAPDGGTVFRVATLDGAVAGYMDSTSLAPRDSAPPRILGLDAAGGTFSPNADGRQDTLTVAGTLSEDATWSVTFTNPAGAVLTASSGVGRSFAATWDGTAGGVRLPDGRYAYRVSATDRWGNAPAVRSGTIVVDTTPPVLTPASATSLVATTFSPNGDGLADTLATSVISSAPGFADEAVRTSSGQLVRTTALPLKAGPNPIAWDGRSDAALVVPDGVYQLSISPRDAAGNVGPALVRSVAVYTVVSAVRALPAVFDPNDANGTAPRTTTLAYTLTAPATVTWTVSDAAGRTVATQYVGGTLAPGPYAFAWDGRAADGTVALPGTYYSNIRASDGVLALRTRAPFVVGAFAIKPSVAAPARGQAVTFTATPAEPLRAAPTLTLSQPGTASRTVTMTRWGTGYRVTLTLARARVAGTAVITVAGFDPAGVRSLATATLPIR